MPLLTRMSLQFAGAKASGKTGLGGGGGAGGSPEGLLEGVAAPEGSVGRVLERCWKGFQHRKGLLEWSAGRGSSTERGVPAGFQQGFQ